MKKLSVCLLCFALCLSLSVSCLAAARVTVDGTEVKLVNANGDPVPEIEGETMAPLRAVMNALGYPVSYDEETGVVNAGTFADPEFMFDPGKDGKSVLIDGTTFVDGLKLVEDGALPFDAEYKDGTIAYTNKFAAVDEGWYRIAFSDGRLLTAQTLPEADLVETKVNEDGDEEEVTKTPVEQVLATGLFLAEANSSDYQLWLVRQIGNKTYALINKATGLAADVNSWSRDEGASIIQYTLAGGTNQQYTFQKAADSETYSISPVYSRLYLDFAGGFEGSELAEDRAVQTRNNAKQWTLDFVEGYTNPVELALSTDAFKELDAFWQDRFNSYFFTDVDFSKSAKDKAETFMREKDFAHQDKETQQEIIKDALDVTYSDLLGGWMREKLTANYEIAGVTRTHDANPEVLEQEDGKDYYIWTINMECGGPDDIHTFTVETVDPDDEEHVRKVCEAVACFEPPVRKTLRHFYYTGDKLGTWNAWDGEVWNNTGGKSDVDGMLTMFAHELGHVIDSYFKVGDDVWRRAINNDVVPTSGYGKTNRWEDFGEFSRLYLMARGDDERVAAIEKIYPNRTKTYRAALYNIDNDYYAEYKDEYDEVTAPIGNAEGVNDDMYYTITTESGALTNNDGVLSIEKSSDDDNQLWQISVLDEQLVRFYSKADGKAIFIPEAELKTEAEASFDGSTAFGIMPVSGDNAKEEYKITATETGFSLNAVGGKPVAEQSGEDGTLWRLTPVEKVEGMGRFNIKSGELYLAPASSDIGARLYLSEDENVWYINKLPNNVGYITDTDTDYAIDISGASEEEGASALAYTLSRNANQMWEMVENENGTVSFKAQHSGLYLAIDEEGLAVQSAEKYEWTLEPAE